MKNGFVLIAVISCLAMGPVHSHGLDIMDDHESVELANTWNIFLKAVSSHDLQKIRDLSAERIRCLSCLDNTSEEEKEIEAFKTTNPDWYRILYEEKIYIPIRRFCDEDFQIIFTKKLIRTLQGSKPTFAVEDFNDRKIYVVMIPTLKPGELSPGHEGCLHLFQFIKTANVYRFWGIDTVP